ncbi:hypothetical protein FBU30_010153 [Linnemannia zychae]|nr:hypothetical protein FBU30_010153 [Linnemannia zychae]
MIHHLNCSYALITSERPRPLSIAPVNSESESMRTSPDMPQAQLDKKKRHTAIGKVMPGIEDDEDGLCFTDFGDGSSIDNNHGPIDIPGIVIRQKYQQCPKNLTHIYGVPGLVKFLGDKVWDTLELTTETWPCLIRFSERFCLQEIKQRGLKYASKTRELWMIAVETLGLDDFKVFLKGIEQTKRGIVTSNQEQSNMRGLKDELLMIFLLMIDDPTSTMTVKVTKAAKAKIWMAGFRRDCGWDTHFSLLD